MLKIITADERMLKKEIKALIVGKYKVGKTTLVTTLPEDKTLFVDMEAGMLSIQNWKGDSIGTTDEDKIRDWPTMKKISAWISGPNKTLKPTEDYSQYYYDEVCKNFPDPKALDKYEHIFIDSISVASRLCKKWCEDEVVRTGQEGNKFAVYGMLADEMLGWITQMQHTVGKSVWIIGLLNEKTDDLGRKTHVIQIEGSKAGLEIPGIVDQIFTMANVDFETGPAKALITNEGNSHGYPAGDRSGKLDPYERPDLGAITKKILG